MEQHGFEIVETGTWGRVITFLSELGPVLKENISSDSFERFQEWRPKPMEQKRDLRERTAEAASIYETSIEKNSDGVKKEITKAGNEARKSGKDMIKGRPAESVKDVEEAGASAARSLFPPLLKLFRAIEEVLYTNVMGKTGPNYFECGEFTVALERAFLDRDQYRVRVIFEDETLLETVSSDLD